MTPDRLADCLLRLEGKARSNGIFWNDAVAEVYTDLLAGISDEEGAAVVYVAVHQRPRLPDVSELARMVSSQAKTTRHTIRDHSQPGHELQRQGVPAYELMRQGFMRGWNERHAGEEVPKEWVRLFRSLDAKARSAAEESDDPFRWKPGEPLPQESSAEIAAKRAKVEQLRREVGV